MIEEKLKYIGVVVCSDESILRKIRGAEVRIARRIRNEEITQSDYKIEGERLYCPRKISEGSLRDFKHKKNKIPKWYTLE
ncbi:MAG: hypothetical protein AABX30_02185 [Nanoarchaeota archaeon]